MHERRGKGSFTIGAAGLARAVRGLHPADLGQRDQDLHPPAALPQHRERAARARTWALTAAALAFALALPPALVAGCADEAAGCQDINAACAAFCQKGGECLGDDSGCMSTCLSKATLGAAPNVLHDCMIDEGCDLFKSGNSCISRAMARGTYSCTGSSTVRFCDDEGCCGTADCQSVCSEQGYSSTGCGFASDKGHDACQCVSHGTPGVYSGSFTLLPSLDDLLDVR